MFWSIEKDGKSTYILGTMHTGIDAQTQQAQATQQANFQRYEQAYGACMGGRGYQVK